MEVDHDDPHLVSVEKGTASAGHGEAVDRGFRKVLVIVRAAVDERDLYAHKSLHFEKLDGDRAGQRSLRINKQWRVIAELRGDAPNKRIGVVEIADYH
ncbi:MAG: type II toxin-antitoxin system RelE/ParE family toxin [Acetobacteraceae bacterium]